MNSWHVDMGRVDELDRIVKRAVVSAVLCILGLTATAPAPAGAAATSLSGFGDILVDAEHGRVLVSSGRDGSSIVVFDLGGRVQKTITGMPGAGAMEIAGDKIYVLLSNGAAIDELDRATLAETATFPVPAADPAESLAYAGGKLWFGAGDCGGGLDLASLDPATG
ncbi:MAG TPA: hypothetical protein VG795_14280, partial [Acidimicrobiia bacterium]|nr:hypothetical protein [Acidimicrobiia bacterium]